MAQMSGKQRQYIQSLADKANVATFAQLNKIAQAIGVQTWQMMNTDQASKMIRTLVRMNEETEYAEDIRGRLGL